MYRANHRRQHNTAVLRFYLWCEFAQAMDNSLLALRTHDPAIEIGHEPTVSTFYIIKINNNT